MNGADQDEEEEEEEARGGKDGEEEISTRIHILIKNQSERKKCFFLLLYRFNEIIPIPWPTL